MSKMIDSAEKSMPHVIVNLHLENVLIDIHNTQYVNSKGKKLYSDGVISVIEIGHISPIPHLPNPRDSNT